MLIDDSSPQGGSPEVHLSLLQSVGRILAEAPLPEDAVDRIIRTVCETLHWDYGARWRKDEQTHHVACTQIWHAPFLDRTEFIEMTRGMSLPPGPGGLVRIVLGTRQPFLIEDTSTAPGLRRAQAAMDAGLRCAFAFPLLAGGQTLGALEFFSRQPHLRNEHLMLTGATIGTIVGEFIARSQSEERYRELVELSPDAILIHCEGRYVFANRAALQVLGAGDVSQFVGRDAFSIVHPDYGQISRDRVRQIYEARTEVPRVELKFVRLDGVAIDVEVSSRYFLYAGKPAIQNIFRDITERKRFEERLSILAQYDVLTGLPNRSLFYDRLRQAIMRARREQAMVGLLYLDLDRFKQINDSFGHAAGDHVLKTIAERLKGFLREIDTIARLGGDEFTVIIEGVSDPAQVSSVAEKIRAALSDHILLDGHDVPVSASVGIALYPRDAEDIEHLVKSADIAMYHAKNHGGRQQIQFYDEAMAPFAADRLEMEAKLKRALENGEFMLQYQPTVDMKTEQIIGMEVLVRWKSPEGLVPPGKFIPVAEESGLILDIGRWVLKAACAQLRTWQKEGLPQLRLAANLSPLQFKRGNLMEMVSEVLRETGLGADHLELEFTENVIMDRSGDTIATLLRLEELGVHLSVDDFGTGYSSLAYLKQFPLHQLKIDKSFIAGIIVSSDDAAIVSAMIAMAKNLGLRVIAEGVESKAQLEFLRAAGCDAYQGYYFSVPLPPNAFADLVRRQVRQKNSAE